MHARGVSIVAEHVLVWTVAAATNGVATTSKSDVYEKSTAAASMLPKCPSVICLHHIHVHTVSATILHNVH